MANTEKEIHLTKSEIELLQIPDDEIEEKESNLQKVHRKLEKKISSLGDDIESEMQNIIRKGKNTLEDDVDAACNKMRGIVETEWGRLTNFESKIAPRLDAELSRLLTRTLKRDVESFASSAKRSIDKCISEFFADSVDVLMKYCPDLDSRSVVKRVQSNVDVEIEENDLFTIPNREEEEDDNIMDYVMSFLNRATWGVLGLTGRVLEYGSAKAKVLSNINAISSDFDPEPYLDAVMARKDSIIEIVRSSFIDELIAPLEEQLKEIVSNKEDKATRLKAANERLAQLNETLVRLKEQVAEVESIKASMDR